MVAIILCCVGMVIVQKPTSLCSFVGHNRSVHGLNVPVVVYIGATYFLALHGEGRITMAND